MYISIHTVTRTESTDHYEMPNSCHIIGSAGQCINILGILRYFIGQYIILCISLDIMIDCMYVCNYSLWVTLIICWHKMLRC